jgi:uncharacterized protein YbjT (DUF2867 family)
MKIIIFGANGQTGRLLTQRVLDEGHRAVAVTRRAGDFPLAHSGLAVAGADVRKPDTLNDVVDGADAVLSTLGVPFTRQAVDTYSIGTANIAQAMHTTGVRRVVVVSSTGAYPARDRRHAPLSVRAFEPIIARTIGKTVYDDIRRMETLVHDSGLDWTVVRPSGLFDLPNRTDYIAGEVPPVGGFTARIDLADYLVRLATDPTTVGRTVTISTTEHTPTLWQVIQREAFKKPAQAATATASSTNR